MSTSKPMYMQIIEYLKEKINGKQLLPGQQLPTEMKLATQFGVSRITSKKALEELEREGMIYRKRGQGSFVSYTDAKSNSTGTNKLIAIVFPYRGVNGWVMSYINGVMSYLNPAGYYLSVHCTEGKYSIEREFLNQLPANGIKGIIYYPETSNRNLDLLNSLCMNGYPIVAIDKYFDGLPISSVVSDNFKGEYMLAEHLIKQGHRRIAYIAREDIAESTSLRDRYLAYCKALKDNNIQIDSDIVSTGYLNEISNSYSEQKEKEYLKNKIMQLINGGVTAILTEHDIEGIKLYKTLSEMGIKVPKDISIAGFDDMVILEHISLPLTTVKQDFLEIGRRAACMIVKCIEEGCTNTKDVVPVELIIRKTTDFTAAI